MRLRVDVTADDIAKGKRQKCYECPVALAASRAAGGEVAAGPFNIWHTGRRWSVKTPRVADQFMADFDAGASVEPFAFDLEIPDGADDVQKAGR